MAFHNVRFPTDISYGSRGGPSYNLSVMETDAGAEQRAQRWSGGRRKYNAAYGIKTPAQLQQVYDFYICRDGGLNTWRYKDFQDYTTASDHRSAHAFNNVSLGTGDGTVTDFQLKKVYSSGSQTRSRNLQRPVSGTVAIGLNGVEQFSGFTTNTNTGIVTITPAPGAGVAVTGGCEFDVHCRFNFGVGIDDWLQTSIDAFDSESVPGDVPIIEEMEGQPIEDEFNFRGGSTQTFSGYLQIEPSMGACINLIPTGSSLRAYLPSPSVYQTGGPHWFLKNAGGASLAIYSGASSIATLSAGAFGTVCLFDVSGTKTWVLF